MSTLTAAQLLDTLSSADQVAQNFIMNSPQWIQYWILFMTVVLVPSFVIGLFKREARWVAVAVFYSTIVTPWLIAVAGPSQAWGLTHLTFWPLALAVIIPKLVREPIQGWYNRYLALVAGTMIVSLIFDAWDVYRFFTAG